MTQSTALATTSTKALARFGTEEDIKALMTRQASIFGIPAEDVARADVQAALVKATQYAITYGYLPGIHVHMLPFNKKVKRSDGREEWVKSYEPALGEKAWKDSADKTAQMQGFSYLVETQEMTAEEVKRLTAADPTAEYTEGDAGFKARVLRSDHANIYRMMGRQYDPEWSYGFWRKKAKKNYKGEWSSDEVPAQRGPRDVAERRAYKAALMKVFTPLPADQFDEARRFQNLAHHVEIETAVDASMPVQPHAVHVDDDGLMTWGDNSATEGHYRTVDADTGEITEPEPAVSQAQLTKLNTLGREFYTSKKWDEVRPSVVAWATDDRATSAKELTAAEADKIIASLKRKIVKAAAEAQSAPKETPPPTSAEDAALWAKGAPEDAPDINF